MCSVPEHCWHGDDIADYTTESDCYVGFLLIGDAGTNRIVVTGNNCMCKYRDKSTETPVKESIGSSSAFLPVCFLPLSASHKSQQLVLSVRKAAGVAMRTNMSAGNKLEWQTWSVTQRSILRLFLAISCTLIRFAHSDWIKWLSFMAADGSKGISQRKATITIPSLPSGT